MTGTDGSIPSDRVEAIHLAAQLLAYAARVQDEDRAPDHADWCALLHAGMVPCLQHMIELTDVLARQMPDYGVNKILRAGRPGGNPYQDILEAASWATTTGHHLQRARETANQSLAHLSHVGVAADPHAVPCKD